MNYVARTTRALFALKFFKFLRERKMKAVGTFKIRDDKVIEEILKTALKVGYRLIDTASVYKNEKSIGNHLKTLMKENGIRQDEIFITSKLSPKDQGYESAKKSFHQTLDNLACQVLDLYLIHWPGKSKLKPEDKINREHRKESWRALEELHQEGLVRAIGVSNYTIKHLEDMEKYSTIKPAVNQVEFHPHLYQKDLLEYCQNKGIQLQAYSSLGTGELVNDPTVNEIAKEYGKSTPQILLKWGLQHGVGVIPKSTNLKHIIENYDIDDFILTDEDMTKMDEMNFNKHYCWDPTFVE